MFTAGRVKSYYLAYGGPGGDVATGPRGTGSWQALRPPPCVLEPARGPRSLLAHLKKSSLHAPAGLDQHGAEAAGLGRPVRAIRKSLSVGDLTHYARHYNKCRRACGPLPMDRSPLDGAVDGARAQAAGVSAAVTRAVGAPAVLRACLLLMLNAWRARREEVRELHARVDQMRLQVTTLRALNKQEGERACRARHDAGKAREYGEALRQQLDALRTEHELAGAASAGLEVRLAEAQTHVENLRNELRAAREEGTALDGQLAKERDKLAAVREERAQLREQVEEGAKQLGDLEALLEAARLDCERATRSAEENGEQVSRMTARCRALEEALESEKLAVQQAEQEAAEHSAELERTRALLALEKSPRRSVCRLFEVLRVPLSLLQAIYLTVCRHPSSSSSTPTAR